MKREMSPYRIGIALAFALLAWPGIASAHLVTTGLGPVYDGVGHLAISYDDLIPVIGLSLLAGLRGPRPGRWALFVLPVAWFVGGLIGLDADHESTLPFHWISFIILGILIATDLRVPVMAVASIAMLMGLVHGFANGTAVRAAGYSSGALELVGITTALFVMLSLFSAAVIQLRWDWTRIAVRVAGSWIAAIGLLILGWTLHTPK